MWIWRDAATLVHSLALVWSLLPGVFGKPWRFVRGVNQTNYTEFKWTFANYVHISWDTSSYVPYILEIYYQNFGISFVRQL